MGKDPAINIRGGETPMKSSSRWIAVLLFTIFLITSRAQANSSWQWLTTSPLPIFPLAVIGTLLIETVAISKFAAIGRTGKVLFTVALANLFSFLTPYLFRAYQMIPTQGRFSVVASFERGPFFIVAAGYLILTLVIEAPVVYFSLFRDSADKKKLALTIIGSNILTTVLVAAAERLICVGRWF
jgi:hypothetical protein